MKRWPNVVCPVCGTVAKKTKRGFYCPNIKCNVVKLKRDKYGVVYIASYVGLSQPMRKGRKNGESTRGNHYNT